MPLVPVLRAAALSSTHAAQRRMASTMPSSFQYLIHSKPSPAVALLTLNRPPLNALSAGVIAEIGTALKAIDEDPTVRATVLTGSAKAFAAGADIKEMQSKTFSDMYAEDYMAHCRDITNARKPLIAAVSGYALGGGCELVQMCDIVLASPTAVFGQPEINLGVIPGMGGTQRLTRAVGKFRAMEILLTGTNLTATEAAAYGLCSRVVGEGEDEVVKEAIRVAEKIASKGGLAIQAAKEAVNASQELGLAEGLRVERRLFHAIFSTADQKEGMSAFLAKRKPKFSHL